MVERELQKENVFKGKAAGVFPGQASQEVGMGLELYQNSRAARDVFDKADNALGFNFSKLIFEGSEEELRDTINSQPAIMTVSIASLRAFEESLGGKTPQFSAMTGHSLGLYTSAVAAGVINFGDGVNLVRERGRLMKEASEKRPGGMAAILGLDQSVLEQICAEAGVEIGNINSDDQIIISGDKIAVARAMDLASSRGARKTISLAVSGAFHSTLMSPAQPGLEEAVSKINFKDPKVPIIANSDCAVLTTGEGVKQELLKGLCACVQWKNSVRLMTQLGAAHFIELGPGRVLSGLIRQINRELKTFPINSPDSIQKFASEMGL